MDAKLTIVDVTGSTTMTCSKQENRERRTAQDLPPGLRQQDAAGAATSGIQPPAICYSRLSYVLVLIPPSTLALPPSAA